MVQVGIHIPINTYNNYNTNNSATTSAIGLLNVQYPWNVIYKIILQLVSTKALCILNGTQISVYSTNFHNKLLESILITKTNIAKEIISCYFLYLFCYSVKQYAFSWMRCVNISVLLWYCHIYMKSPAHIKNCIYVVNSLTHHKRCMPLFIALFSELI